MTNVLSSILLSWFRSYLTGRSQSVVASGRYSTRHQLTCGVPQGSVLGPLLFTLYTQPLAEVIERHGIAHHRYSDDCQLYTSFSPKNKDCAVQDMETCVDAVKAWMINNKLMLNDNKTEIILLGTPAVLKKCNLTSMRCGNCNVRVQARAKSLGVFLDSNLSMKDHINDLRKRTHFYIRSIGKIRHLLTKEATKTLVSAFVLSRLDYCNTLLAGVPNVLLAKLQLVMNNAARLVTGAKVSRHITPVLAALHWLPIHARVSYKLAVMGFSSAAGIAPSYIQEMIPPYQPTRILRSADSGLLQVPKMKTSLGQRAFSFQASSVWNELPERLRTIDSLPAFKRALKTYFYLKYYKDCVSMDMGYGGE